MNASRTHDLTRLFGYFSLALQRWTLWLALAGLGALSGCGGGSGGGGTTVTADTSVPTVVITSDAPATASAAFTLTFTFSGPITIYSENGVLPWSTSGGASGGNSASATADGTTFTKVSDTQYTVRVTPSSWTKGDWTLTLPKGAYKNASGTAYSTEAATITQAIDTNFPIATFTTVDPGNGLNFTGPTLVTVSFNTLLATDLTAAQLVLSAKDLDTQLAVANPGVISDFVKTSGSLQFSTYQFRYTPVSGSRVVSVELPAGSVTAAGVQNTKSIWGPYWFLIP